jgi:hypothetical protein
VCGRGVCPPEAQRTFRRAPWRQAETPQRVTRAPPPGGAPAASAEGDTPPHPDEDTPAPGSLRDHTEHAPARREDVQLPRRVLPEGEHVADAAEVPLPPVRRAGAVVAEAPHPPPAEVGVEIVPPQRRDAAPAVHVPPGDGAPLAVGVFQHGEHQARPAAPLRRAEAPAPLHHAPPVVQPRRPGGDHVHLLHLALPHVCQVEEPGLAVEGEAPGVPQPRGPHLPPPARPPRVRVVRRDRVRVAAVHVQPEQGAQERGGVLPVPLRVAAGAAVAHPHVQPAVRPERQHPAVVVGERLRDVEDQPRRRGIGAGGVGAHSVALHARVPGQVGVVDVEVAVGGIRRVEGQPEQPPLAAAGDAVRDVQERRGEEGAVLHHADAPRLLHDEEARVAGGGGEVQRVAQPARHLFQPDLRRAGIGRPGAAVGAAGEQQGESEGGSAAGHRPPPGQGVRDRRGPARRSFTARAAPPSRTA